MEFLIRERAWMYDMRVPGKSYNNETFMVGVRGFVETAVARGQLDSNKLMRCPCSKCKNKKYPEIGKVEEHLYKYGFVPNYYNWLLHGEDLAPITYAPVNDGYVSPDFDQNVTFEADETGIDNRLPQMISDLAGQSWAPPESANFQPENQNDERNSYFNLMQYSSLPAYDGCTTETELSINMKLLATKANYGFSEAAFDSICGTIKNLIGGENRIPASFRESKKVVSELGMGFKRIDVCVRGCMIYYAEDESLLLCRFYGEPRYEPTRNAESSTSYKRNARSEMFYLPIIPRLQRLFISETSASEMSWHAKPRHDANTMVHPSDGESWKHFDACYPTFASDARNVRLGLCSDGFSPWGMSSKQYSCWPVMLTPYNFPPWMCMQTRFLWLTILIPGPSNPKKRLDIYLRPLIEDLVHLWDVGVETYDSSRKQNFNMKAALMWTISDFPAYGMLSGWSTQGKFGCPYCMEDTKSFYLKNGRKISYFDCHRRFLPANHAYRSNSRRFYRDRTEYEGPVRFRSGDDVFERVRNMKYVWEQDIDEVPEGYGTHHNWTKKSIFWKLPYWVNVKLRHNLDVMHIEKNVFENLFNTIMDVKGKTKDTGVKCRKDIAIYCHRPELELKSVRHRMVARKVKYCLNKDQQLVVLQWLKTLKFPDGFSADLGRHVDIDKRKLVGYKTHDTHVFLERLMAIAFKGLLPKAIWEPVSELCTFFRDICASSLSIQRMTHWKRNIVPTLCKLETIFPPSFFDSMEHLPVHLADEVLLGGPVHYRWMYPFERFIYRLKQSAQRGNRAHSEASIVNAYIQMETAYLGTDYLGPLFKTKSRCLKRNEVSTDDMEDSQISIFNYPGRGGKIICRRNLSEEEFYKATHYILTNTPEFEDYLSEFELDLRQRQPALDENGIYQETLTAFPDWLKAHVWELGNTQGVTEWIHSVSIGFDWNISCTATYKVNNYNFHTESHGQGRNTVNCNIYVKGADGIHYYGVLEEIIHMRCAQHHGIKVVLFKCRWYDPQNVKSYPANGIDIVNTQRMYAHYDPFILAQQAVQVYFLTFPGLIAQNNQGWVAVCRVKPTNAIDMTVVDLPFQDDGQERSQMPRVNDLRTFTDLADDDENEYTSDEENVRSDSEQSSPNEDSEGQYDD
ncbi:unnamed protein product [Rhodiola kirilowii]